MRATLFACCALGMCALTFAAEPDVGKKSRSAKRAELEKQFAATMTGAEFIGHYTVSGQKEADSPKEERYSISKASKQKGDYWLLQVRIRYGEHDLTIPLVLQVKWAGDTPVITLTDLAIPVLGTFTARVLVYRDQYAGTWSAGDHGGQLFGRIEHPPVKKSADAGAQDANSGNVEKSPPKNP